MTDTNQLQSKRLRQKVKRSTFPPPDIPLPSTYTQPDHITNYRRLPQYLYNKLVRGRVFSPNEITHLSTAFSTTTLYVQLEGTLFTCAHKEFMKSKNTPFLWSDYYASITKERIRMHHMPLLNECKAVGVRLIALSSTPIEYSTHVHTLLTTHHMQRYFQYISFKAHAGQPTAQFVKDTLREAFVHSHQVYLLSDTVKRTSNIETQFTL